MAFLKLETNKPVIATIGSYDGEIEDNYGNTRYRYQIYTPEQMTFDATLRVHEQINSLEGKQVAIMKILHMGKNFINVYETNDPKITKYIGNAPQSTKPALKPAPAPQPTKYVSEDDKWHEINLGKCRHGFAVEAFKMKMPLNDDTMKLIAQWAEFSMNGKMTEAKKISPPSDLPWEEPTF